jgi:hypothetical protein
MRSIIFAAVVMTCGGAIVLPASAVPTSGARGITDGQSIVEHVQDSRYCRRLRRACEFKYERGEQGEGNCRRYRRECGRW